MIDQEVDLASTANQRDQAEGERNDAQEVDVTRGPHGIDEMTRQQSFADRDPAEGARKDVNE